MGRAMPKSCSSILSHQEEEIHANPPEIESRPKNRSSSESLPSSPVGGPKRIRRTPPMRPFSPHSRFFSSLKQVEDRLASETKRTKPAPETCPSSDPLSSPIFLDSPAGPSCRPPRLQESSSGPPLDFFSSSPYPLEDDGRGGGDEDGEAADDIEQLMSLLGLSAGECADEVDDGVGSCCDCSGAGGFYSKVAGVKGPKCEKEKRRLDGWIDHYHRGGDGGERTEPARLAHLLLAKAAYLDGEDGLGAIGFPDTVKEFLEHDPPESKTMGEQGTEY